MPISANDAFNPPKELHGIPLSERSQWLLFAPVWMLMPSWRRQVMTQPIVEFRLRDELRLSRDAPSTFRFP